MMKCEIHPKYRHLEAQIRDIPRRFEQEGRLLTRGRNVIKVLEVEGLQLNVKSYKKPHLINRFAYAYLRKTKAERSYRYANLLLERGIGTPEPVAYIVYRDLWGVTRSYFISLQVEVDCEFRDLREQRPADLEPLLRAFTRFTYQLHQNSIYFLDHSPGNTLIARRGEEYVFYLVDLNRIRLQRIPPLMGLKNFYRLHADEEMIDVIADEYARLTGGDSLSMARLLKQWTQAHDARVQERKRRKASRKK
ncbi:MAG: Kdo domain containing protein [Clostridia bacterium]|nr:Kdo domain containing protein [Clostridia bacterium]